MANAPYEVNVTGTDDETFVWALPFENDDGTAFPFADYEIEYVLTRNNQRVLLLTQSAGITIDDPEVTFRGPSGPLAKGTYEHGCRVRHLATGDIFQVFDGTVRVDEGHF
jgi:hypothetical protein